MKVYNLTPSSINFRGMELPPNGGSVDFPGLNFIPDRDRSLEKNKVLAFGTLPAWWLLQQSVKNAKPVGYSNQVVLPTTQEKIADKKK